MTLNKLVKLTMLWTTGPWTSVQVTVVIICLLCLLYNYSGPNCSKLTMSLVNILKHWSLDMANTLIFLLKKMWVAFALKKLLTFFSAKITLNNVLTRTVNILTTKEPIKLIMLWTNGPWKLTLSAIYNSSRDHSALFIFCFVCLFVFCVFVFLFYFVLFFSCFFCLFFFKKIRNDIPCESNETWKPYLLKKKKKKKK